MNQSLRLAFCSLVTAVSTVLMLFTGVIPVGTYALPALAGVLCVSVVIEIGTWWPWAVYTAVSVLSFFIAGDKEAVLCYILLFGCYPIIKAQIEKKVKRPFDLLLKLAFFNVAIILEFLLATYLLHAPSNSYTVFGIYLPWLFLIAGNFVFVLYDYALSLLVATYLKKFHYIVSKWFQRH